LPTAEGKKKDVPKVNRNNRRLSPFSSSRAAAATDASRPFSACLAVSLVLRAICEKGLIMSTERGWGGTGDRCRREKGGRKKETERARSEAVMQQQQRFDDQFE